MLHCVCRNESIKRRPHLKLHLSIKTPSALLYAKFFLFVCLLNSCSRFLVVVSVHAVRSLHQRAYLHISPVCLSAIYVNTECGIILHISKAGRNKQRAGNVYGARASGSEGKEEKINRFQLIFQEILLNACNNTTRCMVSILNKVCFSGLCSN